MVDQLQGTANIGGLAPAHVAQIAELAGISRDEVRTRLLGAVQQGALADASASAAT